MKRTISILVLIAMMLASVLAILPAAAEEAAPARKNVMYCSPTAADTQFAGEGNVFYFDYHYYTAARGQTWPITDKGPSMRHGNNNGGGSASVSDGVKFSGGMDHDFSTNGATLELDDGTSVTHNHIFGYSFKESVTIDGFKLWAATAEKKPINKVTVYGAVVDPAKVEAAATAGEYKALNYCYAAPTLLFEMADGEDLQDTTETEGDKTAAVVAADFEAITIDYILIGVDFGTELTSGDYRVYEIEAYEAPLVKDYDSAVLGDLLYTFNFNGDEAFTPAKLNASADEMEYIVSDNGKTVTIKAKEGAKDQSINLWGGEVAGLTASLDRTYSFRYKARSNSEGYTSGQAKNNSVGIGGWGVDLTLDKPEFYNHYGNHTTADVDGKIDMRRSVISWGGNGSKLADYVMWEDTLNAYAVDADGFMDVLVVFDGPTKMITAYVLDQAGVWQIIQQVEKLEKAGNICFASYAYYNTVNTTITNVRVYKGDYTTYVPEAIEEATAEELETLKLYIDQAEALDEANYTATSWSRLVRALTRAKEIYTADVKPKTEVESRTVALINNLGKLEADTSALNTLVTECRRLVKDDYTADSWATFEAALNAAKNNESVAYEDVKALYDALVAAKAALVVAPADKSELGELLELAALLEEADYAADDWATFTEKLAAAKAVFDAEGVTTSDVESAVKDITRAIKAINGGELPKKPVEDPTEEPTEEPTEKPTEQPTEKPTEAPTAAPTEPANEGGCGGIIGASAVVVAVVLGAVVLKKKED